MKKFITRIKENVGDLTNAINGIKELVAQIKTSEVVSHIKALIEFFDSVRALIEKYKKTQTEINEIEVETTAAPVEAAVETETKNN